MRIGFKSDIHLDFWIDKSFSRSRIRRFIAEILKPKISDVLIIAGDIGHFNVQNAIFLEEIKKYCDYVLVTFGNHDLYLLELEEFKRYRNSFERLEEMKKMISDIEGVYFMDGDLFEIDGFNILGAGGWYDFSYAIKHGYSLSYMRSKWEEIMNDANKIFPKIDPVNFSLIEKEKLRKNIQKADIVFTHVSPVYIKCYEDVILNSFYTFYGYDLMVDNIKYWIFGHCHTPMDFYENHIRFLSSPLGYPGYREGRHNIDYLNFKDF
jgi:DNA repair exonuclease SbcCD nuclease subunit